MVSLCDVYNVHVYMYIKYSAGVCFGLPLVAKFGNYGNGYGYGASGGETMNYLVGNVSVALVAGK